MDSFPHEILARVFRETQTTQSPDRDSAKESLSLALVCKRWKTPAIENLYKSVHLDEISHLMQFDRHLSTASHTGRLVRQLEFTDFHNAVKELEQLGSYNDDQIRKLQQICIKMTARVIGACTYLQDCKIVDPHSATAALLGLVEHNILLSTINICISGGNSEIFHPLNQIRSLRSLTLVIHHGPWTATSQNALFLESVMYFCFKADSITPTNRMMEFLGACQFASSGTLRFQIRRLSAEHTQFLLPIIINNEPGELILEGIGAEAQSVLSLHAVKLRVVDIRMQIPSLKLLEHGIFPEHLHICIPKGHSNMLGQQAWSFIDKLSKWSTAFDKTRHVYISWTTLQPEAWFAGERERGWHLSEKEHFHAGMVDLQKKLSGKNIVILTNV